jgi:hypothetical protein
LKSSGSRKENPSSHKASANAKAKADRSKGKKK